MPQPKTSIGVPEEAYKALPEEVRKAAERAELDKNLPVLSLILQEGGHSAVLAWAAYLDVLETGNVDPFDMPEIVGAALPPIERQLRSAFYQEVRERLLGDDGPVLLELREVLGEERLTPRMHAADVLKAVWIYLDRQEEIDREFTHCPDCGEPNGVNAGECVGCTEYRGIFADEKQAAEQETGPAPTKEES